MSPPAPPECVLQEGGDHVRLVSVVSQTGTSRTVKHLRTEEPSGAGGGLLVAGWVKGWVNESPPEHSSVVCPAPRLA